MCTGVERGGEDVGRHAVGLIVHALAPLVLHDVALRVELLLRHDRQQPPHAVGFEPEHERERIGRSPLEIVGAVVVGGAVVARPGSLEPRIERGVRRVLRAHEHDVLEEVREARATLLLVAGPDMVPDVGGDRGDGVVLVHDQRQAVRQRVDGVGHAEARRLSACLHGDGGRQDQG
jgi:hypothetical protein